MSHVASVAVEIKDLEALKAACERLGWTFHEGATTYEWYGRWVGDTAFTRQMFDSDEEYERVKAMGPNEQRAHMTQYLANVDHKIHIPGVRYEVGVKAREGGGYRLMWDYFDHGMRSKMGTDGGPLAQAYGVEKTKRHLKSRGYIVTEKKLENGNVKLVALAR